MEEEELIEAYLNNNLSNNQLITFEERLKNDIDFFEKVQLEKQLFETLNEKSLKYSFNKEHKSVQAYKAEFENDVTKGIKSAIIKAEGDYYNESRSKKEIKRKRSLLVYASAASVVFFISIFFWTNTNESPADLYAEYIELSELPSLAERGNVNTDVLLNAQRLFENESYDKTIDILKNTLNDSIGNQAIKYVYLGIAQMELNQFDEATKTFKTLAQSDFVDAPLAYWYMALLHLKKEEIKECKTLLKKLINENLHNKIKAEELLIKISTE